MMIRVRFRGEQAPYYMHWRAVGGQREARDRLAQAIRELPTRRSRSTSRVLRRLQEAQMRPPKGRAVPGLVPAAFAPERWSS